MSPGKQEQKTPTEDELDEFERRKNVPPAMPISSSQYMPSNSRSRGGWSVLTGFAVVGLLLGGVAVSFMTMRSSKMARHDQPMMGSQATPMASQATTATSINEVPIAEILRRPTQYIGTEVYVKASYKRMISPRAFIISDGESELLVVDVNDEWSGTSGRELYVHGEVRDVRDMPSDFRHGYKGRVVLRAYRVDEN